MTLYVVINMENGTRLAVAAFSNSEKAEAYIKRQELKDARIDFFTPDLAPPTTPRTLYVAQRFVRDGVYELAGYFFSRYEAERAVAGLGFERRLEIDADEQVFLTSAPAPAAVSTEAPATAPSAGSESRASSASQHTRSRRSARDRTAVGLPWGQLFLFLGLVAGIFGIYWFFHRNPKIQFAEGEQRVSWLPARASNVSYFRQGRFEAFEFQIPEEGFRIWARTSFGAEPGPVPVGGVFVPRYLMLATAAGAAPPPDRRGGTSQTTVEIVDGLYWTSVPPGPVITLAWNRLTGRAYLYRQ